MKMMFGLRASPAASDGGIAAKTQTRFNSNNGRVMEWSPHVKVDIPPQLNPSLAAKQAGNAATSTRLVKPLRSALVSLFAVFSPVLRHRRARKTAGIMVPSKGNQRWDIVAHWQ